MNLKQILVNNYVFQNRFKVYFNSSLQDILIFLDPKMKRDKIRTKNYILDMNCGNKLRNISFPNVFSYAYAVNNIVDSNIPDFGKLNSSRNKMNIDFMNRKFKSNSYTWFLDERLELLISDYDKMYKIDIKSFYKQIYTHAFEKIGEEDIDKWIGIFNNKKTNGLLLGNLLSTFSANEIMEYLSKELEVTLVNAKILYFSDQFYIFFNESDYSEEEVYNKVLKIIGIEYFEFKINDNDSHVFKYEDLIKYKDFTRKVNSLVETLEIELPIRNKVPINKDDSFKKIVKFFNAFIYEYYSILPEFRFSFAEVTLKRTFSTSINLYRLKLAIRRFGDKDTKKIVNDLILLLKNHPSLIINYIELGIVDILEWCPDFDIKKRKLIEYFEKKLYLNLQCVESLYYFHICYILTEKKQRNDYSLIFLNKHPDVNDVLKSIIYETLNITPKRSEILQYDYSDEHWLLQYTCFTHSRYNMIITNSTSKLVKTVNECKKNHIRIINSLENIKFSEARLNKLTEVENKDNGLRNEDNAYSTDNTINTDNT